MSETLNIGSTIRELRRKQKLTGAQLAKKAGISQPKLSKIETGSMANPRPDDIRRLLDILGAPQTIRQRFSEHVKRETITLPFGYDFPLEQVLVREKKAAYVRTICISKIPNLLQTHAYREVVYRAHQRSAQNFASFMAVSSARQDLMWEKHRRYHVLLAEAALYTRVGDNGLHRAQLDRIDRYIDSGQSIRVGIIPYQTGFGFAELCSFIIYDNTSMYIAIPPGDLLSTDTDIIQLHLKMFETLDKLADYGDGARTLVRKAMDYFS